MKLIFNRKFSSIITPVSIDYASLLNNSNLSSEIIQAFGSSGLGILSIKNIPNYTEKRLRLLPLARSLAQLPQTSKEKLEKPEVNYSVGWSHGKENYGDKPDYSKGSFYANPEIDEPVAQGEWPNNVWPKESLPELEPAFKSLGQEIIKVGSLLAKHLDLFLAEKVKNYQQNTLENIVIHHKSHVGRLLHYFSQQESSQNWCGWHNEVDNANAGLFIRNRKGESVKIKVNADELCFQIGETAQILSGGILQATPHAVMTDSKLGNVSRNTFALFLEPRGYFVLNSDNENQVFVEHEGVPSLRKRWSQGITFGEFSKKTIEFFNK